MLITIDSTSTVPIYAQIVASVRSAILEKKTHRGDRLPPARELAASLEINMHTVLRAYAQLKDEGLIELRRGRGATVIGTPSTEGLGPAIDHLLQLAREQGISTVALHRIIDESNPQ